MFSTTNDNNDLSNKVDEIHRQAGIFFDALNQKFTIGNGKLKDEMKRKHDSMRTELDNLEKTNSKFKTDLDILMFSLKIISLNNKSYILTRGNLIGKVWVPKYFRLSFDIKPYAKVADNWGSIMHFTTNDVDMEWGSRNPAIFFHPGSTKLHVKIDTDKANDGIVETSELVLNMVSKITITRHKGELVVSINDKVDQILSFPDQNSYSALSTFYAGNPWFEPAKAELTNVTLVEYQPR